MEFNTQSIYESYYAGATFFMRVKNFISPSPLGAGIIVSPLISTMEFNTQSIYESYYAGATFFMRVKNFISPSPLGAGIIVSPLTS